MDFETRPEDLHMRPLPTRPGDESLSQLTLFEAQKFLFVLLNLTPDQSSQRPRSCKRKLIVSRPGPILKKFIKDWLKKNVFKFHISTNIESKPTIGFFDFDCTFIRWKCEWNNLQACNHLRASIFRYFGNSSVQLRYQKMQRP
ncbi:hypothetical protein RF11_01203 [Thelohanellus kitauei]|uniref:Uncharacterized protein n=1 Tax=Thelohanellus kitauei TaxID=669202 RepID=A0A0C2JJK3_THEKT|nr:hypothetical protein RF11_01203 [Thelohanellus kitauei]